ncbi:MT-A70 family methyltransferase [Streptococcus sp.]|uniref:MT-A70 family methyltransferase n=1 Tax=Streptococcus sp. TaxID=1306 RepID=UPI001E0D44DC|nr:MT-A70 family methyltransferase [Streptococcus sp.]MBS6421496.1 cytosine methyltransferase [Streptococcus sp.]
MKTQQEQTKQHASKKFKTILADPPWEIAQKGKLGASRHYNLMNLEAIKNIPVTDLAEDNAHLWLWTYPAALEQSFEVVRAWGFEPKSIFTWVKPRLGLGNYLRNCTEQMIFATRGKAPIKFKGQMNWGMFPVQDHSHKPEEVYSIIERCSDGDYLELFARRPVPSDKNWGIWGNEIKSDIIIPNYPVPEYSENARDFTNGGDNE